MAKITKAQLRGMTKEQVQALVVQRFDAGKLTQKEFNKANKYLAKLNARSVLTDDQMLTDLMEMLNQ